MILLIPRVHSKILVGLIILTLFTLLINCESSVNSVSRGQSNGSGRDESRLPRSKNEIRGRYDAVGYSISNGSSNTSTNQLKLRIDEMNSVQDGGSKAISKSIIDNRVQWAYLFESFTNELFKSIGHSDNAVELAVNVILKPDASIPFEIFPIEQEAGPNFNSPTYSKVPTKVFDALKRKTQFKGSSDGSKRKMNIDPDLVKSFMNALQNFELKIHLTFLENEGWSKFIVKREFIPTFNDSPPFILSPIEVSRTRMLTESLLQLQKVLERESMKDAENIRPSAESLSNNISRKEAENGNHSQPDTPPQDSPVRYGDQAMGKATSPAFKAETTINATTLGSVLMTEEMVKSTTLGPALTNQEMVKVTTLGPILTNETSAKATTLGPVLMTEEMVKATTLSPASTTETSQSATDSASTLDSTLLI